MKILQSMCLPSATACTVINSHIIEVTPYIDRLNDIAVVEIMFWITDAVMELDTGCWPSGDAARLTAHFSEAEVAGRRRVQ